MLEYHETNDLALSLRRQWGIDDYSPIDIFSLALEKIKNLTIIWMKIDKDISGACSKNDGDSVVVINSIHSKGRQNFTLAHEIYHLLYDDSNNQFFCADDDNDEVEEEANNFASCLLMPMPALREFKRENVREKWTIKNIIKCEQWFAISHKSMLYRLRREKDISLYDFERFKYGVKGNALRLGYDLDLYEPSDENKQYYAVGHLIPLVEKIHSKGKISTGLKNEIFNSNFRSDMVYDLKEDYFFD